MGSSRRRKNQGKTTKVRVGLPRVKPEAPPLPITLPGASGETKWDIHKTPTENYAAMGLELDGVPRMGRNSKPKNKIEEMVEGGEFQLDANDEEKTFQSDAYDELRAICYKERSTGKALPQRLTTNQRNVIEKLIKAHGSDIVKMAKDIKLNRMQHSQGVLRKMVTSFISYPCLADGGHRGFHAPKKSLGNRKVAFM